MAHQWRGVIREYAERLPVTEATKVITLGEGGTPLVHAQQLSALTGSEVYLKVEGANPTGSFKDRGMTMAVTKAVEAGSKAIICASTGNTSAAAAAYAARAGITTVMLPARNRKDLQDVPESARERLKFVWLETVDDAVREALGASG